MNLEDRGRDQLRRVAAAAERDRQGVEHVRVRGLELVGLLERHGVAPIRLGHRSRLGHDYGWLLTLDRRWPGQYGLALNTRGYVFQLYDGDFGQPLIGRTPVARVEDTIFVSAAAAVLDGTFGQTHARKAASRRLIMFALIGVFFALLMCVAIGRILLLLVR